MSTPPIYRLEDRSNAELEILSLLKAEASHLRRGQIYQRMKAESRPTPARVGQVLAALAAEGLLERVHAAARGNRETAFYSLSPRGKELTDRLGLGLAALPRPSPLPPSEVAEVKVAYDTVYRPALPLVDFSSSGLAQEVIEVEIDASGNIVPLRKEGLQPGPALLAILRQPAGGQVAETAGEPPISSLFGLLKARHGVSLDEMDAAVRDRARARFHDRG